MIILLEIMEVELYEKECIMRMVQLIQHMMIHSID